MVGVMTEQPTIETERLILRQYIKRRGKFEDLEDYGILRSEYAGSK